MVYAFWWNTLGEVSCEVAKSLHTLFIRKKKVDVGTRAALLLRYWVTGPDLVNSTIRATSRQTLHNKKTSFSSAQTCKVKRERRAVVVFAHKSTAVNTETTHHILNILIKATFKAYIQSQEETVLALNEGGHSGNSRVIARTSWRRPPASDD